VVGGGRSKKSQIADFSGISRLHQKKLLKPPVSHSELNSSAALCCVARAINEAANSKCTSSVAADDQSSYISSSFCTPSVTMKTNE